MSDSLARDRNGLTRDERARKMGLQNRTHGLKKSREYAIWADMKTRCINQSHHAFNRYGGRGIRVCERWQSFVSFYEDMGPAPVGGTLDRIDNEGGYAPENCRWATRKEQGRNRSTNRVVTINGEQMTLIELAERSKIKYTTLRMRLETGWSLEAAIKTPTLRGRSSLAQIRLRRSP